MALIRSIIHMLWMAITVVPYTLAIVLGSLFGMRKPAPGHAGVQRTGRRQQHAVRLRQR